MSDKYSEDEFESSATTSHHTSTAATSTSSSKATSRSASASASASHAHDASAEASRDAEAHAAASSHKSSDASAHEKHSASDYTSSSSESSSAATSPSTSHASSHHSSVALHTRPSPPPSTHSSSRPSSVSQHSHSVKSAAAPVATRAMAMPADERAEPRMASANGTGKTAQSGRQRQGHGSPRSARGVEEVPVAPVPETQEQLDDMLVDNEDLRERLFELQRNKYRAGLSSTRASQRGKKDETAAAVQESLANERLAQMLTAERKDLRQKRDYLRELVHRYKKATKYRDLIVQAKDDIDMLTEENRDLQLEVRCNEKLLVANDEAQESGRAAHRLQEELRARSALTERGVQHALRDADDAERQRDGTQQRVDRLREELQARRNAPSNRHLDQLEEARDENREKRARLRALEGQLSRARGDGAGRAGTRTSLSLRAEAEREYLRERIAAMREEIQHIQNGSADDLDDLDEAPHQPAYTTSHAAEASDDFAGGYGTALQAHEKDLSGSANPSRKTSTATATQAQSAAWLEEGSSPAKHARTSDAALPASHTAAAAASEADPFYAAAFESSPHEATAAAPPPAPPTYDMSTPATGAAEDDWLLDALREPTAGAHASSGTAPSPPKRPSAINDEAPDWLMTDGNDNNDNAHHQPVEPFVFEEEPVEDIFGDLQAAAPPAPSAPAAPVSAGAGDVPDWLQF